MTKIIVTALAVALTASTASAGYRLDGEKICLGFNDVQALQMVASMSFDLSEKRSLIVHFPKPMVFTRQPDGSYCTDTPKGGSASCNTQWAESGGLDVSCK